MTERLLESGGIFILKLRSRRFGENNCPYRDSKKEFSVHRMMDQKCNEDVREQLRKNRHKRIWYESIACRTFVDFFMHLIKNFD